MNIWKTRFRNKREDEFLASIRSLLIYIEKEIVKNSNVELIIDEFDDRNYEEQKIVRSILFKISENCLNIDLAILYYVKILCSYLLVLEIIKKYLLFCRVDY